MEAGSEQLLFMILTCPKMNMCNKVDSGYIFLVIEAIVEVQ